MTPTKPAGHEDVPEDVLEVGRKTFLQSPGLFSRAVDAAINAAVLADRSRRAKAPAEVTELAPDVKGLVERLRAEADMYGYGQDQPTGLLREAAAALSSLSAPPAEAPREPLKSPQYNPDEQTRLSEQLKAIASEVETLGYHGIAKELLACSSGLHFPGPPDIRPSQIVPRLPSDEVENVAKGRSREDHLEMFRRETAMAQELVQYRRAAGSPPAEAKPVAWRYDLENVPRDRHFLIEYDHKEVTEGYYLDNSKTSVPWQGVRPANSMRRNRVSEKIVAWCEMPLPATDKAPAPPSSDDAPPTESILHPLADREKSAIIVHPDPRAKAAEAVPEGMVLVPREPTQAMIRAGMENLAWWTEPRTPEYEQGSLIAEGLSEEDAAGINEQLISAFKDMYAITLAAAPQPIGTGEVNG